MGRSAECFEGPAGRSLGHSSRKLVVVVFVVVVAARAGRSATIRTGAKEFADRRMGYAYVPALAGRTFRVLLYRENPRTET